MGRQQGVGKMARLAVTSDAIRNAARVAQFPPETAPGRVFAVLEAEMFY